MLLQEVFANIRYLPSERFNSLLSWFPFNVDIIENSTFTHGLFRNVLQNPRCILPRRHIRMHVSSREKEIATEKS